VTEETPAPSLTTGRTLVRSTAWNIAGQVLPLLAALLAIPATLRGLGTERFGALSLAWLLIGYVSLFDLGLGRALTKMAAEKLAEQREDEAARLAWTALLLMVALGLAGALAIALPARFLVQHVLNVPPALADETRSAVYILAASVPFVISTAGLRGLLEARQRFGLVNAIRLPQGVLTYAGPALVVPFSNNLASVVALLAAVRVVAWAVHLLLCLRVFPGLRRVSRLRVADVVPLLRLGGWMTVTNVVGPLMVYLDRFLIGGLLSLSAVAYYATPYEMVTKLLLVPNAIAQVLFPAFSASLAVDRPRAGLLFDRTLKVVFLALFPALLVLATLAPELLTVWLGREFALQSSRVLQWLAVGVFVNGLAQVSFALVQGAGRADFTARLHLAELPFYLAAVWGLIHAWGVVGAAVAWTLRAAVDALVLTLVAHRLAPHAGGPRWRGRAFALCAAAFVLGAVAAGTLVRVAFLMLALAAFAVLGWRLLLDAAEREIACDHLRRWRRR
jgi:O-antigen/teichoic acid export membrane protein